MKDGWPLGQGHRAQNDHLRHLSQSAPHGIEPRGKKGEPGRPIGRTKGGMNTKLHAVTDANGRPISFFVTAGQVSDYTGAAALLDGLPKAQWLLGDRGYDADWFRDALQEKGITPCIRSNRKDDVWTAVDEAAFYEKAPAHLHLALTLALWTGQRQGDLLALTWANYDGTHIRLTQRKTDKCVIIPVGKPLRAALDAQRESLIESDHMRRGIHILQTSFGQPWTRYGFSASWRKACAISGVEDLTFHDLRGTAVTRLALVGCNEAEVATITGHSMKDVGNILDAHYLHRDSKLAESAIHKLERSMETPN
jgi:integrase